MKAALHRRNRVHRISCTGGSAQARPRGDRARPRRHAGGHHRRPRRHTGRGRPLRPADRQQAASITGAAEFNAPPLVSWKVPIERRLLGAAGMRGVVIVSSVAYGDGGGGIPGLLLGSPRDDAGHLIMLGTGQQHRSTVHAADLADFFRRALEDESARGRYVIGNGVNTIVAELTQAAAAAAGAPGAVPVPTTRPGPPGRLLRRGPAARAGHRRSPGPGRARLASISSVTFR